MSIFRLSNSKSFKQCLFNCKHFITKNNFYNNYNHRSYHLTSNNYGRNPSNLRTPDLVYFPQVIRWLKTKIGFKVLQNTWDPEFSEGAFIFGTTQAICKITEVISNDDKDDELADLVTPLLKKKLLTDMKTHLSELQKKVIVIRPKDIKLLIPIEVRLKQIEECKQCSVALRSLAVKWQELNGVLRLAIIALQTEFVRDYTDEETRESGWTVHVFDILECGVVGDPRTAHK